MNNYTKGLLITLAGVLVLSPDSLLVRLASVDPFTIIFYRGVFMFFWITVMLVILYQKNIFAILTNTDKFDFLLGVLHAAGSFTFVLAISYTTIAKALIIISISPFFSAILSYFLLSEKITIATLFTMLVTFCGFMIIFSDGISFTDSWFGNLNAVLTSFILSGIFVISRHKKKSMMSALLLSSFIATVASFYFAKPLEVSVYSLSVLFMIGLILAVSFSLLTLGPKYIPATEANLLMLLKTIFAILLAWIILQEIPDGKTILGGATILVSLALNSLYQAKKLKQRC